MEIVAGVKVVIVLVRCAQSLLLCEDISTGHLRFEDIQDCRQRLPALVASEQRNHGPSSSVIRRCRFLLEHAPNGFSCTG